MLESIAGPEAIEQWRATMTEAEFAARVEGEFPSAVQLQIYSRDLIDSCKALRAAPSDAGLVLGLDPSGEGGDTCRLTAFRAPALWDVTPKRIRSGASEPVIAKEVCEVYDRLGAVGVNIDGLGYGSDIARMIADTGRHARNVLTGRKARLERLFWKRSQRNAFQLQKDDEVRQGCHGG